MRDSLDFVDRMAVRRWSRRFRTPALVDRDVGEYRALLHPGDHLPGDQSRCERPGDQHCADHHVGLAHGLLDLEGGRHQETDPAREDLFEVTHPVDRALEDRDVRAQPDRDHGGVVADDASTDDDDTPRRNSGHASQQQASAAQWLLEEVRPGLCREPACDFAHRRQQR